MFLELAESGLELVSISRRGQKKKKKLENKIVNENAWKSLLMLNYFIDFGNFNIKRLFIYKNLRFHL